MSDIFGREKLDVEAWSSRNSAATSCYWNMSEADNILQDIEDSLTKSPLGGNGFVSQRESTLADSLTDAQALWNYVDYLPYDIDEWIDHPFHLQVNNKALEYLATIDATKITTDNSVGLQGTSHAAGGGHHYTHVEAVSALSLGDFLGYATADPGANGYAYVTHDQKINSFSDLFAAQYNKLVDENPDLTLDAFLQNLLPKEFSVEKDVPLWKELLQTATDLTIVVPLLEAAQGYEFITGDHLTQNEADMKVVTAVIQAISVVATGGGALALAGGGKAGAKMAGKALAAMFISDLAAGGTAVLGNAMDLPPAITAVLSLAAGIAAGKISTDLLFGNHNLSVDKIDDILSTTKGDRPDPSEYLHPDYVENHLANFEDGVTRIQADVLYDDIGIPGEMTFVMPSSVADDLIRQADGDIARLEFLLGLEPGSLKTAPVRVDIPNPTGLSIPSGNEFSANGLWIPGGYTSGGIPEAVIDSIPVSECNIENIF